MPLSIEAKIDTDVHIPFTMVNGLIVLEASIDGVEGSFILDTGADALFLDGNPENTNQEILTPGGSVNVSSVQLDKIQIGSFIQYGIDARVTSLTTLENALGMDLRGIIGGNFFMPHSLIMDFQHSVLIISSKPIGGKEVQDMTSIPFDLQNDIPMVSVLIENQEFLFALDSGASIHVMDQTLVDQSNVFKTMKEKSQVLAVNHVIKEKQRYICNKFALNSIKYIGHHCLSQDFTEINTAFDQPIAGILSVVLLSNKQVVFDFENQLVYF